MRQIETAYGIEIKDFDQPHLKITTELLNELFKPINYNKMQIFSSVATIEWIINKIISYYFYGPISPLNQDFRSKFNSLILSSDWCSFGTKKKLIVHIVNELKLIDGKSKDAYTKLIQETMSYRNALTHGAISTDGRIVKIKYFEGKAKTVILNEDYFTNAEKTVDECYRITRDIATTLGIKRADFV